jgi:serralysin
MSNEHSKWCFAWFEAPKFALGSSRAALVTGSKWTAGDVIEVSFLDGDPSVQKRVRDAAEGWIAPDRANLQFVFRSDTTNTPIRISFQYPGSWSVIGTTCRQITDRSQPTMNFGWLNADSTDDEVRRVVLHEFGHALGLIHEHQNPYGAPIQWSRDAVARDLSGPPNNWTSDVIQHNMFDPYDKGEVNGTALDGASIMMYPIPVSWTLNGVSVGLNSELSAGDKNFIHDQYPQ